MTPLGLYIHVPFCRYRCDYCDFFTRTGVTSQRQREIMLRISHEVEEATARWNSGSTHFRSIYVGGGTPSSLDPRAREAFLDGLHRLAAPGSSGSTGSTGSTIRTTDASLADTEVTVEVNPEDVTPTLLDALWRAGTNRLSVGVQSLRNDSLELIGRHTTLSDTTRGLDLIAATWRGRWSADLITAIPGTTPRACADDARTLLRWGPRHVSVYELGIEPATRLARRVQRGTVAEATDEERRLHLTAVRDTLEEAGLNRYETSNFAAPGEESRHNLAYWRMIPWAAAGPGAVALVPEHGKPYHLTGTRDFSRYLSDPSFGATRERLNSRELLEEYLMGGMRMTDGLDRRAIRLVFGFDIDRLIPLTMDRWKGHLIPSDDTYLRLDREGGFLTDAFLVDAFAELDRTAKILPTQPAWPEEEEGIDDASTVTATT